MHHRHRCLEWAIRGAQLQKQDNNMWQTVFILWCATYKWMCGKHCNLSSTTDHMVAWIQKFDLKDYLFRDNIRVKLLQKCGISSFYSDPGGCFFFFSNNVTVQVVQKCKPTNYVTTTVSYDQKINDNFPFSLKQRVYPWKLEAPRFSITPSVGL